MINLLSILCGVCVAAFTLVVVGSLYSAVAISSRRSRDEEYNE